MADSSRVLGDAISEFCILHAGMLNFDIYDTAIGTVPDAIKPYIRINEQHWEEHPDIKADDSDGFRCALYLPKNRGQGDMGGCPPVMVYRGSDSEERDREQLIFGLSGTYVFEVDFPWSPFPQVPDDIRIAGDFDYSAGIHPNSFGKTFAELRALPDHHEETMFTGVTGTENFQVTIPLHRAARASLAWTVNTSLFYGLEGDWPVNFAQGLGNNVPGQYLKAIEFGRLAADFAATEEWGHQIIFTGHSLGGGLASAGAISARRHKPELRIAARTYNAAGLHENTAARIPASLSAASDVPIRARHVHSEILNSMQSATRIVPFLADVLSWGEKSMPQAVPNPISEIGVSPGPMPILALEASPEGQALPKLFPIGQEEFIRSGFPGLGPIIAAAARANDLPTFVENVVEHIIDELAADERLSHTEAQELQNVTLPDLKALQAPLMAAVTTGSPVPTVSVGTSDYARTTLNPLVNRIVADIVGLARIFLASGNYHTFLPCAYTFLLPGLRAQRNAAP